MDTIYYYYFLFYKKILKEDDPHLTTTLALSASEFFPIDMILFIAYSALFHEALNKWIMIFISLSILLFNYLYFHRTGRAKRIVKEKPMFFNNHKISKTIVIIFFIITTSFLFWGPIVLMYLGKINRAMY